MMVRRSLLGVSPLLLPLLCGCAARVAAPAINLAAISSLRAAAQQVQRCYRTPRVPSGGKQIITRLRVRYGPDGTLAELPAIVSQTGVTPGNQAYAAVMGEAAILSVIKCSPLRLPAEYYAGGWNEFELTFSPRMSV